MPTLDVAAAPSLYEQLGGADNIAAVVDDFYRRVLADDALAAMFAGVDLDRLRRHQSRFISYALGGPNQYTGRNMRAAHAGLGITLIPTIVLDSVRDDIVLRSLAAEGLCRQLYIATDGCRYRAPGVDPMKEILRGVAREHCFACTALVV